VSISSIRLEGLTSFLASKRLAMLLFTLIGISLIPGTFAAKDFHLNAVSRLCIAGLGLNLLLCTLQRIRTLRRPVLIMHAGVFLIIFGTVLAALGSVATVNIYEGKGAEAAYRWDLGRDEKLGYALSVRKINLDYYPLLVRVGVLKGEEKIGRYELKTGGTFSFGGYTIKADSFDPPAETLRLSIFRGGERIGAADTEGTLAPLPGFPYAFKLIAYQNPVLKRAWVDLRIAREGQVLAEGTSEVNGPFEWNGLKFFFTQIENDPMGNPYAGIQIVHAPEVPVVYAGFLLVMAGSASWMYRRMKA
jgi:hypothetical protein